MLNPHTRARIAQECDLAEEWAREAQLALAEAEFWATVRLQRRRARNSSLRKRQLRRTVDVSQTHH